MGTILNYKHHWFRGSFKHNINVKFVTKHNNFSIVKLDAYAQCYAECNFCTMSQLSTLCYTFYIVILSVIMLSVLSPLKYIYLRLNNASL
jgi:hypothetical protein